MVRFTLKQCAYFLAVVDHGGIAQAARSLNISQPAIAQALDKLEDTYGFRLLHRRHARGTEVTPEGRTFAVCCRTLMATADGLEHKARSIAAHLAGIIRFGCFHTVAPFYLAQIVQTYRALNPQVEVVPSELGQDRIVAELAAGRLDLALTYDMGLDGEDVDCTEIAKLEPSILLGADHPLAGRSEIALADMADEPFVMFDGPFSREYFQGVLAAHGIDPPVAFNSSSMESVRCAVANGLGFSLSVMRPSHAATYDGGRVVTVPIREATAPIALVLAFGNQRGPSGLIDDFERFVASRWQPTATPATLG